MLENEKLINLSEASRLIPGQPHPSSVWRACRRGIKARNGKRIRLEHLRCFGRIMTSEEAIIRFWAELARHDAEHFKQADEEPCPKRAPSRQSIEGRKRDLEHAKQRVLEKGI